MLACIACSKHELEDGGDDDRAAVAPGNPSSKEAVKSLTSQLKDMVLKFSGAYRQCKGGSSSLRERKSHHHRRHHDHGGRCGSSYLDQQNVVSEDGGRYGYPYPAASSGSTPTWGLPSFTNSGDEGSEGAKWTPGEGEAKEWMAQVEPGVHITFVSLPGGTGNDLRRIRFSREKFDKRQAQRWWGENYDRIVELYNVRRFSRQVPPPSPPRSEDEESQRESFDYSRWSSRVDDGSPVNNPLVSEDEDEQSRGTYGPLPTSSWEGAHYPPVPDPSQYILPRYFLNPAAFASAAAKVGDSHSTVDADAASRTSASLSIRETTDLLQMTEWVEQDQSGVYITIRQLADGTRELRRVRFGRERFGELHAKLWWEDNRERIQAQYL